jgi:lysine 2,3-aminomutase
MIRWGSADFSCTLHHPALSDRLIINVTNICGMYCRHCQRRRNIGETDEHKKKDDLVAALNYIRANPEIRDVLVTGGDALLLSDNTLDWLLGELHNIAHVEIKRLGTRVPVTLPMRITDDLTRILASIRHLSEHPIQHAKEITLDARKLRISYFCRCNSRKSSCSLKGY